MLRSPRYCFKYEFKKEFLRGRSLVYLAERLGISYSYMSSIIRGVNVIEDCFIQELMKEIGYTSKEIKEKKYYYFTER